MKFEKPSLSIQDQIEKLKQRGMAVADASIAAHYLRHISYYRLRAYWLPFEDGKVSDPQDHHFRPGARFEDVVALYVFDRELRLHILDGIERIEVSVRANWSHHMAMKYGPHGYLDAALYHDAESHQKGLIFLDGEIRRSTETFIKHYYQKYSEPSRPPIWMSAELVTIGNLSSLFSALKSAQDRKAIARPYGVDEKILRSFLHHLTVVRNICAHHGRLWNKQFTITMKAPKYPPSVCSAMSPASNRRLYNTLVMMAYFLWIVSPQSTWRERLRALILANPVAPPEEMGFPAQWQDMPFWKADP